MNNNLKVQAFLCREEWTIPGTSTEIWSPLVLADRATKGLIDSMNKDFSLKNPSGGVIFGMSLVIVRFDTHHFYTLCMHAVYIYACVLIMTTNLTFIFKINIKLNQS